MVGPYFFGMEKQEKRKKGVQIKYNTDEERKDAIQRSKTKYMLNKEWYCDVCKNGHNYSLAGKWKHDKRQDAPTLH